MPFLEFCRDERPPCVLKLFNCDISAIKVVDGVGETEVSELLNYGDQASSDNVLESRDFYIWNGSLSAFRDRGRRKWGTPDSCGKGLFWLAS
jgi:hypothetical protein